MLARFKEEIKGKKTEAFIIYTKNMAEMFDLQEEIEGYEGVTEVKLIPLTPVVGCHAGPGTMGLGYIEKK